MEGLICYLWNTINQVELDSHGIAVQRNLASVKRIIVRPLESRVLPGGPSGTPHWDPLPPDPITRGGHYYYTGDRDRGVCRDVRSSS